MKSISGCWYWSSVSPRAKPRITPSSKSSRAGARRAYIRTVAKERLGLVEPGEELVLLPLDGERSESRLERTSVPLKDLQVTETPYDTEWGYFLEWLTLLKSSFV